MGSATESVHTLIPPSLFGKKGAFQSGDFRAFADGGNPISDGDQVLTIENSSPAFALPPNIFAPDVSDPDPANHLPGVGYGHRYLFDPGGANEQIIEIAQPQGFDRVDPATTRIFLKNPLVIIGGPLVASVDLDMGDSAIIQIGNFRKRVSFIVTAYALDDRGNAACTNPVVTFEVHYATDRGGVLLEDSGITLPGVPTLVGGEDTRVFSVETLGPFPYLVVRPVVDALDGGDTVFSVELVRSDAA